MSCCWSVAGSVDFAPEGVVGRLCQMPSLWRRFHSRNAARQREAGLSNALQLQRLRQVLDQIIRMLQANREPKQSLRRARILAFYRSPVLD